MKNKANEDTLLFNVLKSWKKNYSHEEKIDQERVRAIWKELMGETVNTYTKKLILKDRTLFISVVAASLKQEILFKKDAILASLNKELGEKVVDKMTIH